MDTVKPKHKPQKTKRRKTLRLIFNSETIMKSILQRFVEKINSFLKYKVQSTNFSLPTSLQRRVFGENKLGFRVSVDRFASLTVGKLKFGL
jgi:hypothetical protein